MRAMSDQVVRTLSSVIFWSLCALLVSQVALVGGFTIVLRRFRRVLLCDEQCPRAVIVLCLRGSDPFLSRCLAAVLAQDYPRFSVRVVVDHEADPAWRIVQEKVAELRARGAPAGFSLVVEPLATRRDSCSLKCSSLVQAVAGLDESCGFIAQLDADTIPHPSWLRELATALADERVGAATGNRWYMPDDARFGSLVRFTWNAAAVVQMYWFRIAWGGTLAVKTRVIREAGLLERWSRALSEDTMLFTRLRRHGWKVAFVPSLMMVNRESCGLGDFLTWAGRQLLIARLYHPGWPAILVLGFGTTAALAGAVLLGAIAAARGDVGSLARIAAAVAAYQLGTIGLFALVEMAVRRIVSARGESVRWLSLSKMLRQFVSVAMTQALYPAALFSALFVRRVAWRRAVYQVDGPWKIRLLREKRYQHGDGNEDIGDSL